MHEKGPILINKAIKNGEVIGLDKNCEYLPCHEKLEDCTFCYCLFYPCNDPQTGGYEKLHSRTRKPIWACPSCIFAHKTKNAKKILKGLIKLNLDLNLISREDLLKLRLEILDGESD